jgi:hypothetical protein
MSFVLVYRARTTRSLHKQQARTCYSPGYGGRRRLHQLGQVGVHQHLRGVRALRGLVDKQLPARFTVKISIRVAYEL